MNLHPPSKVRGETLRECAKMVRGMLHMGVTADQIAPFLEKMAEANDIVLAASDDDMNPDIVDGDGELPD